MNKSLKALFMTSMLPVMMLMAAVTLTSCEGTLDDIFGEWSRPTGQQNNEPTKEELLSDLSSALVDGAIVSITYTIDGVEYTSTFKRVGDDYIEQSTTPAATRALTREGSKVPEEFGILTGKTLTIIDPETGKITYKWVEGGSVKLDATLNVKSCELVTHMATEGSGVTAVRVNEKKAAVVNHETGILKVRVNASGETGSDVVNVQIPYTPGQTYNDMVAVKQANGGKYMQIDTNNQVCVTYNDRSGHLVTDEGGQLKHDDVVGAVMGNLCMDQFPPEFYVERSWDATKHKVVSNDKNADNFNMVTDGQTDVTWEGGTYVVNQNVTINGNIKFQGNVNLILCNGCTLKVNGSLRGKPLTIYGQAGGTGKLSLYSFAYGICDIHDLVIHGGNIETSSVVFNDLSNLKMYGGKFSAKVFSSDPVIKTRVGKNMTIYGGELDAVSDGTNAIIVGDDNKPGTLTVYGGKVIASAPKGQAIKGKFAKGEGTSVWFFESDDGVWSEPLGEDDHTSTKHYFKAEVDEGPAVVSGTE